MFADFGVVNFWTYLLGATLIVLVPGPETLFVIKTSITSGIKRGFAAIFSILLSDVILVLLAWFFWPGAGWRQLSAQHQPCLTPSNTQVLLICSISESRRYALSLSQRSKRVRKRNLQLMLRGSSGAECWLRY